MVKKVWILLLCCILCLLIFTDTGMAMIQQTASDAGSGQATQSRGISSFWELTKHAKEFRWPLFATFVIGITLVVKKIVSLLWDWKTSRIVWRVDFSQYQQREQIEHFAKQYECTASNLLFMLLHTLKTSPDAARFTGEVEKFNDAQKQHFKTFQNRMTFWSDTAGALGLLGTVWGMFITFFRGDMDKQAILSGMGIALVTTLMGLIISVILNFFATEVSGFFNKILNRLSEMSDRFWLRILEIQPLPASTSNISQAGSALGNPSVLSEVGTEPAGLKSPNQKEESKKKPTYELSIVSGDKQKVPLHQKTGKPLVVELRRIADGKKQRIAGEIIVFSASGREGTFENGKEQILVPTDDSGRAEAYFTPDRQNGNCWIVASHETFPVKPVRFTVEIRVLKSTDIRIKSGNNQSGPSGNTLSEPLVVEVVDKDSHPIPGRKVTFKVIMGNGTFPNGESAADIPTDEDGLAKVTYTLGRDAGFNAVQAEAADLAGKSVSFQVLGQ